MSTIGAIQADLTLYALSDDELHEFRGGDWWEKMMGFMVVTAFFGGALALPELLLVSAMIGASIMCIETAMTWD